MTTSLNLLNREVIIADRKSAWFACYGRISYVYDTILARVTVVNTSDPYTVQRIDNLIFVDSWTPDMIERVQDALIRTNISSGDHDEGWTYGRNPKDCTGFYD